MASKKSLLKFFIATVFIFFCALSFLFAFTNFSRKVSAELANGESYVVSGTYDDDIGGIHEDWFKPTRVTYTTTTEDGETKILSIVFDANGGVFPFGTKDGEMPSEIPTPTQGQQHRFVGWFTEDGVEVDANTQFTENTTVYARWIAFEDKVVEYDGQSKLIEVDGVLPEGVTVTYYLNEVAVENVFNGATDSGQYNVIASFTSEEGAISIESMSAVLTINKATVQAPVLNSKEYNGNNQTAEVETSELYSVTTNDGGTNVGSYDVVLTLTDSANYKWADSVEETLTLSFEITKKKIEKPVGDEREFTYTGSEQQYEIIESDWYTVSNNKQTNAGNYTVTVALVDVDNTEWKDGTTENLTFNFTIEKLKINVPEQDTREFIYTGNPQTYTIASSEYYEVQNNFQTNAGSYDVTVSLKDTANTIWSDDRVDNKTFKFIIAKATYAMSHVKFNDVTVVEDGQIKNITISGVLPEGVSVAYYLNNVEFMGVTEAGIYLIIAKFSHVNLNYNDIADMSAVLTINRASYEHITDNVKSEVILIPSSEGISPDINIEIKYIEDASEISAGLSKDERPSKIYDITLYKQGAVVQPNGLLTIKILIPTELLNTNFKIIHIHDNSEYLELDYSIEGEYVVIETDKLSKFAFVYTVTPLTWLIVVLAVISILEGLFLILQIYKNKSKKVVKTLVVFPVFAFGLFIELWQFAVIWLLAGTAIVLLVSNIVYPFIKRKS